MRNGQLTLANACMVIERRDVLVDVRITERFVSNSI
jgi:hypothetical protein